MLQVYESPASLSPTAVVTANNTTSVAPASGIYLQTSDNTLAWKAWAPVSTQVLACETPLNYQGSSTSDVVSVRPEKGVMCSMRHKTGDYKYVDVPHTAFGIVTTHTTSTSADSLVNPVLAAANGNAAIVTYDNDWTPFTINIQNANVDASYMVETCACWEIQPGATTVFYNIAKDGPATNVSAIKEAETTLQKNGVVLEGSCGRCE